MNEKKAPLGIPKSIQIQQDNFSLGIQDPKNFKNLRLAMKVSGGVHGEKFNFDFDANAAGDLVCGMNCQISDRQHKSKKGKISAKTFKELVGLVNVREYAKFEHHNRIPPCSLVGRIELLNGNEKREFVFMADKGQAEEANFQVADAMSVLIDKIYSVAEGHLKSTNVRP